jgi:hypothetical protein
MSEELLEGQSSRWAGIARRSSRSACTGSLLGSIPPDLGH